MEKMLSFMLIIELSKKDLKGLGYPEKVTQKSLWPLSREVAELLDEKDIRPYIRLAAKRLGNKVNAREFKDIATPRTPELAAKLREAKRLGGMLIKPKVLLPLEVTYESNKKKATPKRVQRKKEE